MEGPFADDRMSSFPPAVLLLAGVLSCGTAVAGRGAAGAEHGRGPQPAVWRSATVLRLRWPPSPCRGEAVDCVLLMGGVAGAVVLLWGCDACYAVGGGLQSEAALIDVRLDVGSLPPDSSSPTERVLFIGTQFSILYTSMYSPA